MIRPLSRAGCGRKFQQGSINKCESAEGLELKDFRLPQPFNARSIISFKPRLKSRSHRSLRSLFDCFSGRFSSVAIRTFCI